MKVDKLIQLQDVVRCFILDLNYLFGICLCLKIFSNTGTELVVFEVKYFVHATKDKVMTSKNVVEENLTHIGTVWGCFYIFDYVELFYSWHTQSMS